MRGSLEALQSRLTKRLDAQAESLTEDCMWTSHIHLRPTSKVPLTLPLFLYPGEESERAVIRSLLERVQVRSTGTCKYVMGPYSNFESMQRWLRKT